MQQIQDADKHPPRSPKGNLVVRQTNGTKGTTTRIELKTKKSIIMIPTNQVDIISATKMIIEDGQGVDNGLTLSDEEYDNGNAVQIFRAVHDVFEEEKSEERIDIMEHKAMLLGWYYKVAPKTALDIDDVKHTDMYAKDQRMGLRIPSYGELVWFESGKLTPVITVELPATYQMVHKIRTFAHKLYDELSTNKARIMLKSFIDEINSFE